MAANETAQMLIEQSETIKLEKNSKGYNWEVKIIIPTNKGDQEIKALTDVCDQAALNRLKKINDELQKQYGQII